MRRQFKIALAVALVLLSSLTGCHPTQPFFLQSDGGDLSHYIDQAQRADFPDVEQASFAEAAQSRAPLTISNNKIDATWDMTLEEAISIALHNSEIIRNSGVVSQPGVADSLLSRTAVSRSVYDPAIVASTTTGATALTRLQSGALGRDIAAERVLNAQQLGGVEDALAEFDAHAAAIYNYGKSDRGVNIRSAGSTVVRQFDTSNFDLAISKKIATGGVVSISNSVAYSYNNTFSPLAQRVPSDYTAIVRLEARHPLLRGRGTLFNRIPIILARINEDISVGDFEVGVRDLLLDIENTYWDLYCAFRTFETAKNGRDAALKTWRNAYELYKGDRQNVQSESQSREQYFFFRAQLEGSQADVYETEARLRWLLGLAPSDGRIIRPKDEPASAKLQFDWFEINSEALYRSAELRQQKWRLKQRDLELRQARNQMLPSLNLTASHSFVGVADELISADRTGLNFLTPGQATGSNAYEELTEGNFQESFIGLEFLPPAFGARKELARVRFATLQQSREKVRLRDMELQLSHMLATAVRNKDRNYRLAQSHLNRWAATEREIESADAAYDAGRASINNRATIDILLDAQRRRAQAQFDYYRSLCEYNKAIADIHRHKGSLLDFSGIMLTEGPWPDKAYHDALEKARHRDASYYLDYGWTRPNVVSRGPVPQGGGHLLPPHGEPLTTPGPNQLKTIEDLDAEPIPPGQEPTPVSNLPEEPTLAPLTRQAESPLPITSAAANFEWGGMGLPGGETQPSVSPTAAATPGVQRAAASSPAVSDPSEDGNPLRQAAHIESLR